MYLLASKVFEHIETSSKLLCHLRNKKNENFTNLVKFCTQDGNAEENKKEVTAL